MEQKKQISKVHIVVGILFIISVIGLRIMSFVNKDYNITLNGERLRVIVADNSAKQFKGLGGMKSLGDYDGMLFVGLKAQRIGVVMRDMLMPIDVVWFHEGEVVDIAPNVPTEPGVQEDQLRVYLPRADADVFLELPAGWTVRHGLKIGDKLGVAD